MTYLYMMFLKCCGSHIPLKAWRKQELNMSHNSCKAWCKTCLLLLQHNICNMMSLLSWYKGVGGGEGMWQRCSKSILASLDLSFRQLLQKHSCWNKSTHSVPARKTRSKAVLNPYLSHIQWQNVLHLDFMKWIEHIYKRIHFNRY